jgi:integrase
MAYAFRRNGGWYAGWKDGAGRKRRQLTSAVTKSEARRIADDLERKAERQRLGLDPEPLSGSMTVSDLVKWWVKEHAPGAPHPHFEGALAKHVFRHSFGATLLRAVRPATIETFLKDRERSGLAPASVNHLRGHLLVAFNAARRKADPPLWSGPNPVADVPRRKVPVRVYETLKAEEVPGMLANTPAEWRNVFATAVWMGLRKGELLGLRKADIDFEARTLTVRRSYDHVTTKGRRAVVLPLPETLVSYLRDAVESSSSELVFPNPDGSMRGEHSNAHKVLRHALARAGIVDGYEHRCRRCAAQGEPHRERHPDCKPRECPACGMALWPVALPRRLRFHDLRGTTATMLARAGVPLVVAQKILRHCSPVLTANVYTHVDLSDMRDALNRITPPAPLVPEAQADVVSIAAPVEKSARQLPIGSPAARKPVRARRSLSPTAEDRSAKFNGPARIRTWDQAVMSRQL